MSKWTSDSKQRASKKYRELHAALARELSDMLPKPSAKQTRHKLQSEFWRQHAEALES